MREHRTEDHEPIHGTSTQRFEVLEISTPSQGVAVPNDDQ